MPEQNDRGKFRQKIRADIDLAGYIDAAVLKTESSIADIEEMCRQAMEYHFKAVFANPAYTRVCATILKGSGVKVGSVAGFPLGATTTEVKVYEAADGENHGAEEIDMVANVGAIKSGNWSLVEKDIAGVRKTLSRHTILKVIIEASHLRDEEKINVAHIIADSGAEFVKTATGFFGQATTADVSLLFEAVGKKIGVKASGGIRTLQQALAMIEAGASRIGTSSGASIIEEQLNRK